MQPAARSGEVEQWSLGGGWEGLPQRKEEAQRKDTPGPHKGAQEMATGSLGSKEVGLQV